MSVIAVGTATAAPGTVATGRIEDTRDDQPLARRERFGDAQGSSGTAGPEGGSFGSRSDRAAKGGVCLRTGGQQFRIKGLSNVPCNPDQFVAP